MILQLPKYLRLIFLVSLFSSLSSYSKEFRNSHLSGYLYLETTWNSMIYLSFIPTFEKMYEMSYEMIISEVPIDSTGYFELNIDYLPCEENLFRLHIVKKGDTPATLVIGGKDENHLFLILNCDSRIEMENDYSVPPFENVVFKNSRINSVFQSITSYTNKADSLASESGALKRKLIEKKKEEDLLLIADTTQYFLASLYAIYKGNYESNYSSNTDFYNRYTNKWKNQNNGYYKAFTKKLPNEKKVEVYISISLLIFMIVSVLGFIYWKHSTKENEGLKELSIQERKVFDLLRKGASNQEISEESNISISTVKSHVSSIYSKLKVKSRKDIMNL